MARSSALVKITACVAVICIVMGMGAPFGEAALTCGPDGGPVASCIPYLTGKIPFPGNACCNGVTFLKDAASNTQDRQTACKCLKQLAAESNVNSTRAGTLPGQCTVNFPYPIAPTTDCSKVH